MRIEPRLYMDLVYILRYIDKFGLKFDCVGQKYTLISFTSLMVLHPYIILEKKITKVKIFCKGLFWVIEHVIKKIE